VSALTNADNAQSLVDEDGVVGDVVSTPIGTAVLDLLAHANGRGPELLHIGVPGGSGGMVSAWSMAMGVRIGSGGGRTGGRRKYHTCWRCCIIVLYVYMKRGVSVKKKWIELYRRCGPNDSTNS
jgi:hypothetical protein